MPVEGALSPNNCKLAVCIEYITNNSEREN